MDIKKSLKDVIVLLVICSVFAVALATTNLLTADIIADKKAEAASGAYAVVMPDAKGFSDVNLADYTLPGTITEAKRETSGLGFVVTVETTGYGSGMVLLIGVSSDGTIIGATCLQSNETNGVEKNYGSNFIGKGMDDSKAVDTIAGSTLTTVAYKNAIVDAINTATILGGGSADVRTEEEILSDNLNTALGLTDAEFSKEIISEVLAGVEKIYKNDAGYVFKIGDNYVGVTASGAVNVVDSQTNLVTEGVDELKATAAAAYTIVAATELTEIDIAALKDSADREVKRIFRIVNFVKKTATGNYIIEIQCDGHGRKGDPEHEHASGERYTIVVCISADGVILDSQTVSHSETPTWGGPQLEDGAFNSNFIGKDETGAGEVDAVAGTTNTTSGYIEAVLRCFEVIRIIEGGATNE